MVLRVDTYTRKTFSVEAVQVTSENLYEIAVWCNGVVKNNDPFVESPAAYVEVPVVMTRGVKRDKAFIGDWVTRTEKSHKAYRDEAFQTAFSKDAPSDPALKVRHEEVFKLVKQAMFEHEAHSTNTLIAMHLIAAYTTNRIVEIFEGETG